MSVPRSERHPYYRADFRWRYAVRAFCNPWRHAAVNLAQAVIFTAIILANGGADMPLPAKVLFLFVVPLVVIGNFALPIMSVRSLVNRRWPD